MRLVTAFREFFVNVCMPARNIWIARKHSSHDYKKLLSRCSWLRISSIRFVDELSRIARTNFCICWKNKISSRKDRKWRKLWTIILVNVNQTKIEVAARSRVGWDNEKMGTKLRYWTERIQIVGPQSTKRKRCIQVWIVSFLSEEYELRKRQEWDGSSVSLWNLVRRTIWYSLDFNCKQGFFPLRFLNCAFNLVIVQLPLS